MIAFFRRSSKSLAGTIIAGIIGLMILIGFAAGDVMNVVNTGFGGQSGGTLAKVGGQTITDREMDRAMQRRLNDVRETNPAATYATIAADFEPLLDLLIDQRALQAFADKHGLTVSKRLIDAEIVQIPGTRGLNGKFDERAYQALLAQQRMTDQELRQLIASDLLQRLLLRPIAANARMPVGMATPYASMLLEFREGEVAIIPVEAFRAGLKPTDVDLERFYAANRNRYMVPEQRVLRLAKIGPEQVAGISASDQEITAFYNSNEATYAPKDIRVISQAVVPDKATAEAIAQRARSGAAFAAAAAPAGLSAEDISVGPQTREEFASIAGDAVAAAAFKASPGGIAGPVQSDLGWHVVKIDSVRTEGGKPLAAARAEIAAKLTADKRKEALAGIVDKVQDAIDGGANFNEAAVAAKLPVTQTPLIAANGASRADPGFKLPPEYAGALKSGFDLAANDEPVIETLVKDEAFVLVAPAQIVPAAPAALASIRDRVAIDWIARQASDRARAVASAIAAKVAKGMPVAQALKEAGTPLPAVQPASALRNLLSELGPRAPAPLRILFSLGQGKSRMIGDPEGQGFFVVKLNKITPGNAGLQPLLIARVESEFREALSQEYAQQFMAGVKKSVSVTRNDSAIAAAKARITGS
jgi:peptidyl-prolyl cis-trans isomerase D